MLREILERGQWSYYEGFDNWEDAVRAAVKPLIDNGAVKPGYADSIVAGVHKFGPYIVITKDICIPHAADAENVNETTMSFMKTKRPVYFDGEENPDLSSRLFFVLAASDETKHLENLRRLMGYLCDEEFVAKLADAENMEAAQQLIFESAPLSLT